MDLRFPYFTYTNLVRKTRKLPVPEALRAYHSQPLLISSEPPVVDGPAMPAKQMLSEVVIVGFGEM